MEKKISLEFVRSCNGSVSVIWRWLETKTAYSIRYRVADKRFINVISGEQDAYKVSVAALESTLDANGVMYDEIEYIGKSLTWYGYNNGRSQHVAKALSRNFVRGWVGRDCPESIYVYESNDGAKINCMGKPIPVFSCSVISVVCDDVYLDSDIEYSVYAQILSVLNPEGEIAKKLRVKLEAIQCTEEYAAECEKIVLDFETEIARVVLQHKEVIADCLSKEDINKFDCGDTYFYPYDGTMIQAYANLVAKGKRSGRYIRIDIPATQSTTVQRDMAHIVKTAVKNQLGIEIFSQTQLD